MIHPPVSRAAMARVTQKTLLANEDRMAFEGKRIVLNVVSQFLDYPSMFYGTGRHAQVVVLRMAIAHHLRTAYKVSFPVIAIVMGRPNHSSTITSIQRWEQYADHHAFLGSGMEGFEGYTKSRIAELVEKAFAETDAAEVFGLYHTVTVRKLKHHWIDRIADYGYFGA